MRLSENTDIREWWSSWNQDDDVMGRERPPISEPLAGLLAEQIRAQTLHRFALKGRRLTPVGLEIGDEPIGIG